MTNLRSKQLLTYMLCNNTYGAKKDLKKLSVFFKIYDMFCQKSKNCQECYIGRLYNLKIICIMSFIQARYKHDAS